MFTLGGGGHSVNCVSLTTDEGRNELQAESSIAIQIVRHQRMIKKFDFCTLVPLDMQPAFHLFIGVRSYFSAMLPSHPTYKGWESKNYYIDPLLLLQVSFSIHICS
jgi:hypothetical protein